MMTNKIGCVRLTKGFHVSLAYLDLDMHQLFLYNTLFFSFN